jgi:FkbM family methyltransferase
MPTDPRRSRIRRLARPAVEVARRMWSEPEPAALLAWRDADGDRVLRQEYDLDERSLVFDLGGYEGQWASDIVARYRCETWVFEPVPAFAELIRRRFARNQSVRVFQFGLADRDRTATIELHADASSMMSTSVGGDDGHVVGDAVDVRLVDVVGFFEEHAVDRVDLMKLNIEGGEYDLLDRMLGAGLLSRIGDLQVQFHDFVPGAERRMQQIREGLAATHHPTYQFDFVWENWRLKTSAEGEGAS